MDETKKENACVEMSDEEYRDGIIEIFQKMNESAKLRFWYKYISGMEKGRD